MLCFILLKNCPQTFCLNYYWSNLPMVAPVCAALGKCPMLDLEQTKKAHQISVI